MKGLSKKMTKSIKTESLLIDLIDKRAQTTSITRTTKVTKITKKMFIANYPIFTKQKRKRKRSRNRGSR